MQSASRVVDVKRIYAEGLAASVGAANPYYGQRVNAAVWRGGYRRMLDAMLASSPARRGWWPREPFECLTEDRRGDSNPRMI
ncbi:hypothetical protein CRM90_22550 [Mycobacterium sp. ENV421]|uniref:ribosome modulation factor n=1 Tax=Mycobacterium sp. ENV421 TaxID=1213407 RepID=UPI000C9B2197|nr:hypothetical protein [Mycobacterium sp. ENV421]PND55533.1 hypothetical protein CRM90_22550 [Mycobacterium sp. ENV421]